MKRKRNLIILCSTLAVICLAIIGVKAIKQHVDSISTVDEIVYESTNEQLSSVKWTYSGATLEFIKDENGNWKSTDDANFPVDQDKFASFLKDYESIHASFLITDVADYGQYGLDNPSGTVTLVKDGVETTIKFGDYSTMDSKRYLTLGDGKVYLVDEDPLASIITDRDDFILNDTITKFTQVTELSVSGENNLDIIYDTETEYSYSADDDYFLVKDGKKLAISSSYASSFIKIFTGLSLTNFVTYTASAEDLSAYGLDNPDVTVSITGTVYGTDGEVGIAVLYIGSTEDGNYVRVGDSEIIYSLTTSNYETIVTKNYDSLRSTYLVECDESIITCIDADIQGEKYRIEHLVSENTDEYQYEGKEITASTIMYYIEAACITDFECEEPDMQEELVLSLALDNADYPQRTIAFYRYDGDKCIVKINGELIGYVDRADMTNIRESIYDVVLARPVIEEESSETETE